MKKPNITCYAKEIEKMSKEDKENLFLSIWSSYSHPFIVKSMLLHNERKNIITALVESKIDIDTVEKNTGKNALHLSILQKSNTASISYLIKEDIKLNIKDNFKMTALDYAIEVLDIDISLLLINNGSNVNECKTNILTLAIRDIFSRDSHLKSVNDLIKSIINHGEKTIINRPHNLKDKTVTPLTMCIINKREDIYQIIKKSKDVDTFLTLQYLIKNDIYFTSDVFEKYLDDLLTEELEDTKKVSLLMQWSAFDQRIDVSKIEKCLYLINILQLESQKGKDTEGFRISYITDLKTNLYNSLYPVKYTTFKSVLAEYIHFPKHDPKRLSEALKKFSNDERLKYTNHPWDGSPMTHSEFMENVKLGFEEIKNDLKFYAPNLYENLKTILFDKNEENGWSSEAVRGLINMEDTSDKIIKDLQQRVKALIVIKNDNKECNLLNLFTPIKEEISYNKENIEICLENIKGPIFDKIFTNIPSLSTALKNIFMELVKLIEVEGTISISVEFIGETRDDFVELRIIHKDSISKKTSIELKETIVTNGGDFKTIQKNLLSVCDWSIETTCNDGKHYKIDYLYQDMKHEGEARSSSINTQPKGFTHVLRFYK